MEDRVVMMNAATAVMAEDTIVEWYRLSVLASVLFGYRYPKLLDCAGNPENPQTIIQLENALFSMTGSDACHVWLEWLRRWPCYLRRTAIQKAAYKCKSANLQACASLTEALSLLNTPHDLLIISADYPEWEKAEFVRFELVLTPQNVWTESYFFRIKLYDKLAGKWCWQDANSVLDFEPDSTVPEQKTGTASIGSIGSSLTFPVPPAAYVSISPSTDAAILQQFSLPDALLEI